VYCATHMPIDGFLPAAPMFQSQKNTTGQHARSSRAHVIRKTERLEASECSLPQSSMYLHAARRGITNIKRIHIRVYKTLTCLSPSDINTLDSKNNALLMFISE